MSGAAGVSGFSTPPAITFRPMLCARSNIHASLAESRLFLIPAEAGPAQRLFGGIKAGPDVSGTANVFV